MNWRIRRFLGLEYHNPKTLSARHGTFVMDVEWQRTEELRPERLGPSEDDVQVPPEMWRPKKTLRGI